MELGTLEMSLAGEIKEATGEVENLEIEKRQLMVRLLEDAGVALGDESFRRLVVAFSGYEYLLTVTKDSILAILRQN